MANNMLTKTCTICGEKKPLAAFRSLSGRKGPLYSNICASCRSSGAAKKTIKEADDGTTSRTGHQIDSKSKVYSDTEIKESFEKELEEYHKERDEDAELEEEKLEESKEIAEKERDHREKVLDKDSRKSKEKSKKEAHKEAQAKKAKRDHARQGIFNKETANMSEAERQEAVRTGHDFSVPFYDPGITGQIKYTSSDAFLRFRKMVAGYSPIGQREVQKETAKQEQTTEEKLIEYADKTWSPKSRGGR